MAGPNTRFHLDKERGKLAGVCAGLADHFGVDVTLVRVGTVLSLLIGGPLMLIGYGVLAAISPNRPATLDGFDPEEKKFWQKVRTNPRRTAHAVRARFREIDRRLADVEAHLTSPDARLAREIDSLR